MYNHDFFQIIAEGANGPCTMGADKIFQMRNILVIPVSRFIIIFFIATHLTSLKQFHFLSARTLIFGEPM